MWWQWKCSRQRKILRWMNPGVDDRAGGLGREGGIWGWGWAAKPKVSCSGFVGALVAFSLHACTRRRVAHPHFDAASVRVRAHLRGKIDSASGFSEVCIIAPARCLALPSECVLEVRVSVSTSRCVRGKKRGRVVIQTERERKRACVCACVDANTDFLAVLPWMPGSFLLPPTI